LPDTEKADWIQYVRNLNDRRLNRRTSSGFQAWTVLAFTALCFSRVLQLVPRLVVDLQFRSDLLVVTSLELYAGVIVLFSLLTGPVSAAYRALHESKHIHSVAPLSAAQDHVRGWGLSMVLLICVCLWFVTGMNTEPQWTPSVFYWAFWAALYYCVTWTIRSYRRATLGEQSINLWGFLEGGLWKWLCCVIMVATTIAWVLAYRSSNVLALETGGVNLLTAGFAFIGVLLGLVILTLVLADSLRDSWLEEFETAVLLEDMSAKTIRDGLVRGYLGQDLTAALEHMSRSANDASAHCLSAVEAATKGYVYTAMLDPASADFSSQLDSNFKFMGLLTGILTTAVRPAQDEVGKICGTMQDFLDTAGDVSARAVLPGFKVVLHTTTEASRQLGDLLQTTLNGMFSDFLATAAKAHREDEARQVVEQLRGK